MGSIRTFLAIAVVFSHTAGAIFVGGRLAVELFYLISGFLISFLLVERKTYRSVSSFYLNRFLRLYPMYFVVALATLLIHGVISSAGGESVFFSVYKNIDLKGQMLLIVSNMTIFGQDWVMFTGVREGMTRFVTDFNQSDVPVWQGLLVPQAWTLGVELSFYVIAPFVLRSRKVLVVLLVLSLSVRAFLWHLGLASKDPWTYRFFPAELALFLLGALSHQVLRPLYARLMGDRQLFISKIATAVILAYCVFFSLLPGRSISALLLIILFILALPLLFHFQCNSSWDQKIGDLSYPVYISHMMIIYPVHALFAYYMPDRNDGYLFTGIVVGLTLLASYLLVHFVGDKVELIRSAIKSRQKQVEIPVPTSVSLTRME